MGATGGRRGGGDDTAGSSAAHAAMDAEGDVAMNGEEASGGRRVGGRRKRGRAGGEMAVVRFAAFAAGVRVEDVTMVGGVHELAGSKRTVDAARGSKSQ